LSLGPLPDVRSITQPHIRISVFPAVTMALTAPVMRMASSGSLLPRLLAPTLFSTSRIQLQVRQFSAPLFPSFILTVPVGFQLGLPSLGSILGDIWESVLRAVPKKKTSHMKKRHRQMAGKALKDVNSLCKCPACGEVKRMHYLCPNCAKSKKSRLRREASILTRM
jgi:large subunit ribosomal protein L32